MPVSPSHGWVIKVAEGAGTSDEQVRDAFVASSLATNSQCPGTRAEKELGLGAWTNFSLRFSSGSLSLCATASLLLPSPKPRIGFGRGRANAHARDH